MKDLTYRPATIDNFDKLWQLVEESLSGKETKITRTSLREDLFGARKLELGSVATGHEEPSVELDLNLDQAQASVPFCQVFLAQMGCQQVGYLMFHQFYSPWKGRKACIDYIYVKQKYRNMGKLRSASARWWALLLSPNSYANHCPNSYQRNRLWPHATTKGSL